MPTNKKSQKVIRLVGIVEIVLGLAMGAYWVMYLAKGMEVGEAPVLSECVTALLALVTGVGLTTRRRWALPCSLVLAGMWGYGVIAGIGLVLRKGIDFSSPFGAITDAVLFPLILIFSVYMAVTIWRHRDDFAA